MNEDNLLIGTTMDEITEQEREDLIKKYPEIEEYQNLSEEEAFQKLGIEKTEVYQGMEEILKGKSRLARQVAEFLMENYRQLIPIMLSNGELKQS